MKFLRLVIALILIVVYSLHSANVSDFKDTVPGVVVIKFKSSTALAKSVDEGFDKIKQKYSITELRPVIERPRILAKPSNADYLSSVYYAYYSGSEHPQKVADEIIESSQNIIYAEPKYIHKIDDTQRLEPDDPLFLQQPEMEQIKAPGAWSTVRGEMGDVIIAIVDGGTEVNHPDLNNNIWINPGEIPNDNIDNDNNGYIDDVNGWNFTNNSNDPTGLTNMPGSARHGTHTAGTASAVTDNNTGVAGVSWNAKIMPICGSSRTEDRSITYGYDGIIYAFSNGADIISCSWGRSGGSSQFEQDVLNQAAANGSVVVVSAGNESNSINQYPAAYNNSFSVAAVDAVDKKAAFSSFGRTVDVAAPGVNILSTILNGEYGSMDGTSMSCPMVSGVIALVMTQNPTWTGQQAAEQVRISADNIDSENPLYIDKLGQGRINAENALQVESPSIRILSVNYTDDDGNDVIEPGDYVNIDISVINYLKPASNISFLISSNDPYIEILQSSSQISELNTLEEKRLENSLRVKIGEDASSGYAIELKLQTSSGGYQGNEYFNMIVLPSFATLDVNNIDVTITNIGRIGFGDFNFSSSGTGFSYQNGPNLLFEGAVIAGVSADRLSNAARGVNTSNDMDFTVADYGDLVLSTPGTITDQESFGKFDDSKSTAPLPVRITQETYASAAEGTNDFVIFKYQIQNIGNQSLTNFHFGLFFDWDIDGQYYATNKIGYDSNRHMGYAYDTGYGPETYAGVSLLSGEDISFRAIYNDGLASGNPSWGIYEGFSDAEKWESISGGITYPEAGPEDVSFVISAGPIDIAAGERKVIGFAMIAGTSLSGLQGSADSADVFWEQLLPLDVRKKEEKIIKEFRLKQNYPNPFNPVTILNYELPITNYVELSIYNSLGQKVINLVSEQQQPGSYQVEWNATDFASGVYYYQLRAGSFVQRKKMLLLR